MAKTKKAIAQQIFKQHLKVEKAQTLARAESQKLEELASSNGYISELIEHEGTVFRVSSNGQRWPGNRVNVERVAAVTDLERVIK